MSSRMLADSYAGFYGGILELQGKENGSAAVDIGHIARGYV